MAGLAGVCLQGFLVRITSELLRNKQHMQQQNRIQTFETLAITDKKDIYSADLPVSITSMLAALYLQHS